MTFWYLLSLLIYKKVKSVCNPCFESSLSMTTTINYCCFLNDHSTLSCCKTDDELREGTGNTHDVTGGKIRPSERLGKLIKEKFGALRARRAHFHCTVPLTGEERRKHVQKEKLEHVARSSTKEIVSRSSNRQCRNFEKRSSRVIYVFAHAFWPGLLQLEPDNLTTLV